MINLMRRLFIKNYKNVKDPKVREAHGRLASIFGVLSNCILFLIKLLAGILSHSISIIADGINNLADMGSSVITLIGFRLANAPADKEHPYGHQRIEYISGLIVSIIIIAVGGNLLFSSIEAIIEYEAIEISKNVLYVSILILSISILIKLLQALVNKRLGRVIQSVALEATSRDSLNDCLSTLTLLIGNMVLLFVPNMPFSLDGVMGIIVSLFIIYSGIRLVKETVNPLIGLPCDPEVLKQVIDVIQEEPMVLGFHDPICHQYGPNKLFMTIHVEVDENERMATIHEMVDELEKKVLEQFDVILTIHMDPIQIDNEEVNHLRTRVKEAVKEIDDKLSMHDFRVVMGKTHISLIFDIVIPYNFSLSEAEILRTLQERITDEGKQYAFIVHFDSEYNDINKEYE